MTKKIISILLSVLMIFSTFPMGVFALEDVELNLGTALINGAEVKVPVTLNKLPDNFDKLASLYMEYAYDSNVLTYEGVEAGAITLTDTMSRDGAISWFDSSSNVVADDTILFYLLFTAVAQETTDISITKAELGAANHALCTPETNTIKMFVKGAHFTLDAVAISNIVRVDVYMDRIPTDIKDLAAVTLNYSYDKDVLAYRGTLPGALDVAELTSANDGNISWFTDSPLTTINNARLFTLVFDVVANNDTDTIVNIESAEIVSSSHIISEYVELGKVQISIDVPAYIVSIKTNIDKIDIPVNTPDIEAYIRSNLIVHAVYNDSTEEPISNGYTLEIANGKIKVSYGTFDGDDIDMTYTKAQIKAGDAEVDTTERTFRIPVTMDGIPGDMANVASVEMSYTYDSSVMYVGIEKGIIPVDTKNASDGNMLWSAEEAPITDVNNATLFTLVFKAPCDADKEFDIVLDAKIADNTNAVGSTETVKGTVKVYPVAHVWSSWKTTSAPTLTSNGVETRTCENCDQKETRAITLTDVVINKTSLEVPYRFHSQGADKKMEYIKSQTAATAVFSDEAKTEIDIPTQLLTFTDENTAVKVAYKDVEKTVAITLGAPPAKPEVYPGVVPKVEDNRTVEIPVIIADIPDTIVGNIDNVELTYTFDASMLGYKGTDGGDSNLNSDGSQAGKIVIDAQSSIEVAGIANTKVAVIKFVAPCNAEGNTTIEITGISINGVDVASDFLCSGVEVVLVAKDCKFTQWQTAEGCEPTDYKNGKEIRTCEACGMVQERPITVAYIEHAMPSISVPNENHKGKTSAQIADYLKTLGTLATAMLTNEYSVNLDNDDIIVDVDTTVPKATITYKNAYKPATGETYDATCEIALELVGSGISGGSNGGSNGGGRPAGGSGNTLGGLGGGFVTTTPSTIFNDVPATHYAYEAIKNLYSRGIVTGDSFGRINPDLGITREETAKVALLINGINVEKGLPINFDDKADVSAWAYDYVATAIKYGVLNGYDDGTVRPGDTVSREELVAIVIRGINVQINGTTESKFADVASERWSAGYIRAASDLGLVTGYTDGTFKPASDIKRAEAFTIYHRVLNFKDALSAAIK